MGFTLTLRDPAPIEGTARASAYLDGDRFCCSLQGMRWLTLAMDLMGVLVGGDAPPSAHGQVDRRKLASMDGWEVSAEEAATLAAGTAELLEADEELELLYDLLDVGHGEERPVLEALHAWLAFQRRAARGRGFVVS